MATIVKSPFGDCELDCRKNFGGYILEHLRLNSNSRWVNATSHAEQTYGVLANQVEAIHGALQSLGVCAGDKLCLIVANRLELLPMLVGAACANVAVVCDYHGYSVEALIELMKDIEFTIVCCEASKIDSALQLRASQPTIKHIITVGELASVPTGAEGVVFSWNEFIEMGTEALRVSAPRVEYQANCICYMRSTSGTTGKPKMVVHYHDSLVASVKANSHQQHMNLTAEDVLLCTSTLGHVYALFDCVCKAIVQGATCAFLEEPDTVETLEALQRLKAIYGQTEFVFIAAGLHDLPPRFTSMGCLGVGVEAMVIDVETKQPLGPMQHGELLIRGPGLMRGYWGRLDEPCTDAGRLRLSESIYCRNVKVVPADIEAVLLQCADVKDCVVVGLPHLQAGQLPHAVIVSQTDRGHLGPEHYIRFVDERMPKHCHLEGGVTLVDSIPRNKLGKVARHELLKWVARAT
ncbi:hypothetical protein MTO96_005881 [Rhipicephalus appendiculatus]